VFVYDIWVSQSLVVGEVLWSLNQSLGFQKKELNRWRSFADPSSPQRRCRFPLAFTESDNRDNRIMSSALDFHVGQRLSFGGDLCTVRFIGIVQSTKGAWLGVEWDDPSRGKHDGSVKGLKYFQCKILELCLYQIYH